VLTVFQPLVPGVETAPPAALKTYVSPLPPLTKAEPSHHCPPLAVQAPAPPLTPLPEFRSGSQ